MSRSTMPRLCCALSALVTLIGVVLRTICMLTCFDAEIGYFEPGILPMLSRILYVIAVAVALIGACLIPKDGVLPKKLINPHRAPFALAVGVAMALFTVILFVTSYATLFTSDGMLRTILMLFGLLGSSYFFLSVSRQGRYPDWLVAVGFLPILWAILGVAETYTDIFVPMNSPVKVSLQMGFLGFMLLMITELRFRLGRAIPRIGFILLSISVFLTLNASIPLLAAAGVWGHTLHTLYAFVLLVVGVYSAHTLFCYTYLPVTDSM